MNVNTGIYFDDMDYIEFGTDRGQFYCGEGKMFFIEMTHSLGTLLWILLNI